MRRGLGKGLHQFVREEDTPQVTPAKSAKVSRKVAENLSNGRGIGSADEVSVDLIFANPNQPRTAFDHEALEQLARSIQAHGVLQPLLVRPGAKGYELIAGERRLRAAKLAGLKKVPVVVRTADTLSSFEMAMIENLQREDINPVECARAYRSLIENFGQTQERIASAVGRSRSAIANTLRLLQLPGEILEGVEEGLISEGHARALVTVEDPALQLEFYHRIVDSGLSVREIEALVARKPGTTKPQKSLSREAFWGELENGLSMHFGSKVQFQVRRKGGKMTVDFYSQEDLQRILDLLGIQL